MDIFTILVFFLLVNSADVQTLPDPKELELPASQAEQPARESVVIMLNRNEILLQGQPILSLDEAMQVEDENLPRLAGALATQVSQRVTQPTNEEAEEGRGEITIMADKNLPFSLLKKVMLTCTQAQFNKISLAVLQEEQLGGL
jgi:biopolymer transport protein ExbD